jgi:hypothetical protein
MFIAAMGLFALSSFILLVTEFRRMAFVSRALLLIQIGALVMMVVQHRFPARAPAALSGSEAAY